MLRAEGLRRPGLIEGATLAIAPGETYRYDFEVRDRAGMYWYHPHTHERTGAQTYRGMAGLLVVRDDEEAASTWRKLAGAADRFLGRRLGNLGAVYQDAHVTRAVRRQRAVLDAFPTCPAARCYERIALELAFDSVGDAEGCRGYWTQLDTGRDAAPTGVAH